MANNMQPKGKNKALTVIIIAIIAILIIVLAVLALTQKEEMGTPDGERNAPVSENSQTEAEGEVNLDEEGMEETDEEINSVLEGAITQAPGADSITTEGKVVNNEGKEVRTDVEYNSPEAPQQTQPIENEEDLAEESIKLSVSSDGFSPESFTVSSGQAITVALTGVGESSHIMAFEDSVLSSVFINTRPGETRAVTFNAPSEPGEYTFFCDFPGHRSAEEGIMVVE